jgi:hypothetical protein
VRTNATISATSSAVIRRCLTPDARGQGGPHGVSARDEDAQELTPADLCAIIRGVTRNGVEGGVRMPALGSSSPTARPRRLRAWALVALVLGLAIGVPAAWAALGGEDTATGTGALASENGGDFNTADGYNALTANTAGSSNTAVGDRALDGNDSGDVNTAVGAGALHGNLSGDSNTAVGAFALFLNGTESSNNTAVGELALRFPLGNGNTALGAGAASQLLVGSDDTFVGADAGFASTVSNATAVGANAVVSRSDSLVLGAPGVNVGIDQSAPQSRLQIGAGASATWGEYLQLPVVTDPARTPPAADCDTTTKVGRLVLQQVKKRIYLWACSPAGVWVKV